MPAHRIPLLDHWKLLLIWLVVFGHVLVGHPIIEAAIYSFHMPAFVFLAGATSRPKPSFNSQAEIVLLLVAFQAGYVFLLRAVGWQFGRWWAEPVYIMWFFASLLMWRWLLRPLLWTRWPLVVSVALALLAGATPRIGVNFSASRTLVFLPFFVAGHLYGLQLVHRLQTEQRWLMSLSCAAVGLLIAFGCAFPVGGRTVLLKGKLSYAAMNVGIWQGLAYRAAQLLAAAAVTLCFFFAASRPSRWAGLGKNTRQVYLFHGFLASPLVVWLIHRGQVGNKALLLGAAIATAAVYALSQPFIARMVDAMLRPCARWVERIVLSVGARLQA